jgi:hypothetical protein
MSFGQTVFDETKWNCGNQKVINLPMMIDAATLWNRNKKKNFWKIEFFLSKLTFRHFIFVLKSEQNGGGDGDPRLLVERHLVEWNLVQ